MASTTTQPSSGSLEFDKLRDHLATNPTVRKEMENAFAFLLARANPSDRAARFVVGGAVEWIVAAAAWSAKVLTVPGGHNANGFDLTDLLNQAKGLWSVKFGSQKRPSDWRLTNGLGGAGKGFVDPTIFVHKRLGGPAVRRPCYKPSDRFAGRERWRRIEACLQGDRRLRRSAPRVRRTCRRSDQRRTSSERSPRFREGSAFAGHVSESSESLRGREASPTVHF